MKANYDTATTGFLTVVHPHGCANGTPEIRIKAYHQWKPAGTSPAVGEWVYSRTVPDPASDSAFVIASSAGGSEPS